MTRPAMTIFTIGHSTHVFQEFVEILRAFGIRQLVSHIQHDTNLDRLPHSELPVSRNHLVERGQPVAEHRRRPEPEFDEVVGFDSGASPPAVRIALVALGFVDWLISDSARPRSQRNCHTRGGSAHRRIP